MSKQFMRMLPVLAVMFGLFQLPVFVDSTNAATINLPASGQNKCYDPSGSTTAEIPCAGTGQDGAVQAGVVWPDPRFTVSGACVTDNLTGLMWSQNANLPNGTRTWQGALDWVAALNSGGGLCGYTDWRLPNRKELKSLVNRQQADSAGWLNTQGFSGVSSSYNYWSSSTNAHKTSSAWGVLMGYGNVYSDTSKDINFYYVWPVRGGQ